MVMETRGMKLLFVTSEAHMYGVGGGVTCTLGILAVLKRINGITVTQLVLPLPFKNYPRLVRKMRALGLSLNSQYPSKSHYLLSRKYCKLLEQELDYQAPDILVLNGADLLPLVNSFTVKAVQILIAHNIESKIIESQVANLHFAKGLTWLLKHDIEKTRQLEDAYVKGKNSIITVSQEDAQWFKKASPEIKVETLNGIFSYPPYPGPRPVVKLPLNVAFLAKMSWWPNRQAAEWFISAVLPSLSKGLIKTNYYGPGSEKFTSPVLGVEGHGWVENLNLIWSRTHFTICPILDGSGINIKLIESLYNGVPVLATPQAVRGLKILDDPAIAVVEAQKWPAFLNSKRAQELAATTVNSKTSGLFSLSNGVKTMSDFLKSLHR